MINKLTIQNFQSHFDTELVFDKGVNIIIGSSDTGKSAIVRSIKLLKDNRPLGDTYISDWGGATSIIINVDDNRLIKRTKSDNENSYSTIIDNDYQEYSGFGTNVPDNIQKLLNLSDLNMQYQLDPIFLVSKSNTEIARYLNEIIDLSSIDVSLSSIEKAKRKEKSDLKYTDDNLDRLYKKIEGFSNLPELENLVEKLKLVTYEVTKLEKKHVELKKIVDGYNQLKEINIPESMFTDMETIKNEYKLLENMQKYLCFLKKYLKYSDRLSILEAERKELFNSFNICPLCKQEIKK